MANVSSRRLEWPPVLRSSLVRKRVSLFENTRPWKWDCISARQTAIAPPPLFSPLFSLPSPFFSQWRSSLERKLSGFMVTFSLSLSLSYVRFYFSIFPPFFFPFLTTPCLAYILYIVSCFKETVRLSPCFSLLSPVSSPRGFVAYLFSHRGNFLFDSPSIYSYI